MKKKCDLCGTIYFELDLFHYEQSEDGIIKEVVVCENCLFDLVDKDFCDGVCT